MDAIENLLDFGLNLRFEDLPIEVVERTRLAVLDTMGAALAGLSVKAIEQLSSLATSWGGTPEATALTTAQRLPLPLAGLLNGAAARAWDLDDVHEKNTCHISCNIVPAALALAEARGPVTGRALIAAIAAGTEIVCRLSAAPRISFSETGSAKSYQCGYYAVALVAARMMGLSHETARHALGIAHARVAGNQQAYLAGASTVYIMQGIAVEGGLVSALMAERGITGSSEVLEGRFGYYPVYHRGQYERAALLDGLGAERWMMLETTIKQLYPCCKFTHGPIEAAFEAMRVLGAHPDDIQAVRVQVNSREAEDLVCLPRERKWNPQSSTDAQFSLPFTVAYALVHGEVGPHAFSPQGLHDPLVRKLMPLVGVEIDISKEPGDRSPFPMPGSVTVTTQDGRMAEGRVDLPKGHPDNPMSFDEIAEKFRKCAQMGRPGWNGAERIIDAVKSLDSLEDAGALARMCICE